MNTVALTLNKPATLDILKTSPKLRVRLGATGLEVRPTDRVSPVNLPKGEKLVSVELRGGAVPAAKAILPIVSDEMGAMLAGKSFVLSTEGTKYGWYALTAVDAIPTGTAGAKAGALVVAPVTAA